MAKSQSRRRITYDLPAEFVDRWEEACRRVGQTRRASLLEALHVWVEEAERWLAAQEGHDG
jgi:predicted DNA-binding protein